MANTRIDACKYLVDTSHPDYTRITVAFVSDEPEHHIWGAGVKTRTFPAAGAEWEPQFKDALGRMSFISWDDADEATTALLGQGLTIPGTQVQLPPDYIPRKQALLRFQNQNPGTCTCGVPYPLHGATCGWAQASHRYMAEGFVKDDSPAGQKREQAITAGLVSEAGSLGHPGNPHSLAAGQQPGAISTVQELAEALDLNPEELQQHLDNANPPTELLHATVRPRTHSLLQTLRLRRDWYQHASHVEELIREADQARGIPAGEKTAQQVGGQQLISRAETVMDRLLTEILLWQRLAMAGLQYSRQIVSALPTPLSQELATAVWSWGAAEGDIRLRANEEAQPLLAPELNELHQAWPFLVPRTPQKPA